jgi:hypothetical protein
MAGLLSRVIVGNLVVNPEVLREYLRKSHYFMTYDPNNETIEFKANHGKGGQVIMEIRNASHESAVKLAQGLGLTTDREYPTSWSKWNPVYWLYHDGSVGAETLRMEMLKLSLPFNLITGSYMSSSCEKTWAWNNNGRVYTPPMWSVESVVKEIREDAERYKEQIASMP